MPKQLARRWLAGFGVCRRAHRRLRHPRLRHPCRRGPRLLRQGCGCRPRRPCKGSNLFARTRTSTMEWGEYTVKVDRSKVAGFADVRNGNNSNACTESGAILTCKVVAEENDYYTYITMVNLVVRAKKSATPDQRGEITFTVTDRDGGSATHHSSVSIGEGVDLAGIEQGLQLTGALGGTLDVPLTVANRGEKTVHDVVLYFEGGYGFGPSKRYKNCEYSPTDAFRHAFACRFPNTIEPGGAARLDSSFGFTVPADDSAPNGHTGSARWHTPADWEEFQSFNPARLGQQGTEGELRLEPLGLQSRSRQTDINDQNGSTVMRLQVSGDQGAEVAALGTPATATGKVGATVPLKVGYVNNGPAAVTSTEPRISGPVACSRCRAASLPYAFRSPARATATGCRKARRQGVPLRRAQTPGAGREDRVRVRAAPRRGRHPGCPGAADLRRGRGPQPNQRQRDGHHRRER